MNRIWFNIKLAIEQVMLNRLRSLLTALGIIFGVGAVIAMLAIGAGAQQAILEQMKLIGANNVLVRAMIELEEEDGEDSSEGGDNSKRPLSSGLQLADARAIEALIPSVETISPEIERAVNIIRPGMLEKGKVVGIENSYFDLHKLALRQGQYFHAWHHERGMPVCIIGPGIQQRFFQEESPLGRRIKCGQEWLTIIGVIEGREADSEAQTRLGIRDNKFEVYVPLQTCLVRFVNRSRFAQKQLGRNRDENDNGPKNYHQLDRLTVRVSSSEQLRATAGLLERTLQRRHQQLQDFEVIVPELLLEQERETQQTFNIVLAAIAFISLLVGGIGIMNIMLASVLERVHEIGIRRSLGATERDILLQFIFEAVFICLVGGILGISLGILIAHLIAQSADIPTVVTGWSVALSFVVATSVGLIFGITPARRAARLDPITALRSN